MHNTHHVLVGYTCAELKDDDKALGEAGGGEDATSKPDLTPTEQALVDCLRLLYRRGRQVREQRELAARAAQTISNRPAEEK